MTSGPNQFCSEPGGVSCGGADKPLASGVRVDVRVLPVDDFTVLHPTAWVYLFGVAQHHSHDTVTQECGPTQHRLRQLAHAVLPPSCDQVEVEFWPPEPALFDGPHGTEETRVRLRAVASTQGALESWIRALREGLIRAGVQSPEPAGKR